MTQIWGQILDRPLIHEQMWPHYFRIIDEFNAELDGVKIMFDKGISEAHWIDVHFPPCAGKLTWIYKLRERLVQPMESYEEIANDTAAPNSAIYQTEDSENMLTKYKQMLKLLEEEETKVFNGTMLRFLFYLKLYFKVEFKHTLPVLTAVHMHSYRNMNLYNIHRTQNYRV